jgi:hypothetical protein
MTVTRDAGKVILPPGLYSAQGVLDLAGVPRASDRTTIDHALIRGLATAPPGIRRGLSSL